MLVRARDDEVGACRQRVLGQRAAEGQVRAPRLVDDQRHAVGVGDARQAADVGHGAEVGRRDDDRRRRAGRGGERRVQGGGQDAVRDPQPGVDLGRDEGGAQPREDHPVDRAGVDGALHDDALAALRDGQAGRHVALRRAVGEKPRPPRAPGVGRQPARDLVRGRRGADAGVDALDQGRDVERERCAPSAARSPRSAARPPLCPGTIARRGWRAANETSASRYGARRWPGSCAGASIGWSSAREHAVIPPGAGTPRGDGARRSARRVGVGLTGGGGDVLEVGLRLVAAGRARRRSPRRRGRPRSGRCPPRSPARPSRSSARAPSCRAAGPRPASRAARRSLRGRPGRRPRPPCPPTGPSRGPPRRRAWFRPAARSASAGPARRRCRP